MIFREMTNNIYFEYLNYNSHGNFMSFSISEKCFTPLLLINYVHIWEALFYPQQVKNTIPKKILRFFITYKLYKKVRFTLHQ